MGRGRGSAFDRRIASVDAQRMDAIAHAMAASEQCTEARRLVEAGARAGIVSRLYSLAIIKPINAAEREARLSWGCNLAMARDLTAATAIVRNSAQADLEPAVA